ncbi:MAG: phosphate acyltransferase [Bacillales bacterium]|jgi:glycerol-3-phosphate acyltransferase PlsX|nr:phosphate acyltransferase [Bacillales bacterium]
MYKIAIDAMGGDHAPKSILEGVNLAIREFSNIHFLIFGDESKIDKSLVNNEKVTFIHTSETISSTDEPVRAVRMKKDSSMVQMAQYVKEGKADACISAGNTGALMTTGIFVVGRAKGIDRPALAPLMPTVNGKGFLLLDVGANIDAKVNHLVQYAQMGSIYAEKVLGRTNPRVGLVNIGTEEHKGTDLYKDTYAALKNTNINFIGNIEARDLLLGEVDVAVTDGFTGNQILKSIEGTADVLFKVMKEEFTKNMISKLGAMILKPSLKSIKKKLDYSEAGGAALFGLNAPVIKAHGSSNSKAIFNAIRQTVNMLENNVIPTIKQKIEESEVIK